MTGQSMTELQPEQPNVLWADAELESLSADYDVLVLKIQESTGAEVRVSCHGYIGYERIGAWDELIIASACISASKGDFMSRCMSAIESSLASEFDSGSPDRNAGSFHLMEITFVDSSCLQVAAARFEVDRPSGS
jgi:hypothetical protein